MTREEFIEQFKAQHGRAPYLHEISEHFALTEDRATPPTKVPEMAQASTPSPPEPPVPTPDETKPEQPTPPAKEEPQTNVEITETKPIEVAPAPEPTPTVDTTDYESPTRPLDLREQKLSEVLQKRVPSGDVNEAIEYLKVLNDKSKNAFELYDNLRLVKKDEQGNTVFDTDAVNRLLKKLGPPRAEQQEAPVLTNQTGTPSKTTPVEEVNVSPVAPSRSGEMGPDDIDTLPPIPEPLMNLSQGGQGQSVSGTPAPETASSMPEGTEPQGSVSFDRPSFGVETPTARTTSQTSQRDTSFPLAHEAYRQGADMLTERQEEARRLQEQSPETTLEGFSAYTNELLERNKAEGQESAKKLLARMDANQRGDFAQSLIHALGRIASGVVGLGERIDVAKHYSPEKIFDRGYEDTLAQATQENELRQQRQDLELKLSRAKNLLTEAYKFLDPTAQSELAKTLRGLDTVTGTQQQRTDTTPIVQAQLSEASRERDRQRGIAETTMKLRADLEKARINAAARLRSKAKSPKETKLSAEELKLYSAPFIKRSKPLHRRATPEEVQNYTKQQKAWADILSPQSISAVRQSVPTTKTVGRNILGLGGRTVPLDAQEVIPVLYTKLHELMQSANKKAAGKDGADLAFPATLDQDAFSTLYSHYFRTEKGDHTKAFDKVAEDVRRYANGQFRNSDDVIIAQGLGFNPLGSGWSKDEDVLAAMQNAPQRVRTYYSVQGGGAPQGRIGPNYPAQRGDTNFTDGQIEGVDQNFATQRNMSPKYLVSLDLLQKHEGGINTIQSDKGNVNPVTGEPEPTVAGIAPKFYYSTKGKLGGAEKAFGKNHPTIPQLAQMYQTNRPLFNKYKAIYYQKNYWEPLVQAGLEQAHPAVGYAAFDHAVNRRTEEAKDLLARALTSSSDPRQQLQFIQRQRSIIYRNMMNQAKPDQRKFFKNWAKRAATAGNSLMEVNNG